MEQSSTPGSQNKRKPQGMSPPPTTGGDADSAAQEKNSPPERPSTPPVPLLRPARGAWDKAHAYGNVPLQVSQAPGKSSPSAHTRSKDNRPPPSGPGHSRVSHPESAQRHSQPPGPSGSGSTSAQLPSYPATSGSTSTPAPPAEYYRQSGYSRHNKSPPQYATSPPDVPALPPPARSPPRYPPSNYYPPHSPPPAQAYPRYTENPYPPTRSQQPWQAPPPPEPQEGEIISLLIEDMRGGVIDFLVADVKVVLQPMDDGGWWTNAEMMIKALQRSTQRLEGAAKFFARRGKYRQCFARMAEDGMLECLDTSVMVLRDKTVQMMVETNPDARYMQSLPPLAEAYPRSHESQRLPYDYYQQSAQASYSSSQYPPPSQNPNGKRPGGSTDVEEYPAKRSKPPAGAPTQSLKPRPVPVPASQAAPSSSRPTTAGGPRQPGVHAGLGLSSAGVSITRASSPESLIDPISPYGPFQRHESVPVAVKAPKEVVNASIVAYLRSHIQNEEGYLDFAGSKGRLLPIPDLLRGYRFATRIVNMWANRKTPPTVEGCPSKRITKNHVLQALFRQTSWGSDCEQTLQLADKYGSGGPREDSRVVDLLSGGAMLPEKSGDKSQGRSQGSVALLDFLKDIDREHKAKLGEDVRNSVSSTGKDENDGSKAEGDGVGDGDGEGD